MKILIGIDDSACSEAALQFARMTPWPAGTQFIVASSVAPPVLMFADIYVPSGDALVELMSEQRAARKTLVSDAAETLADAGLPASSAVLDGDPRVTLLDLARQERVDLIVLGSHGRTGIPKLLLGSVASHIVSHAPCNVLVVRRPGAPS